MSVFDRPSVAEVVLVVLASAAFWLPRALDGDAGTQPPATAVAGAATTVAGSRSLEQDAAGGTAGLDPSECDFLDELTRVREAVVAVFTEFADGQSGWGTGFHLGDGEYVTAAHVVIGEDGREAPSIAVVPVGARNGFPAEILRHGSFADTTIGPDLAVIRAQPVPAVLGWRAPEADDAGRDARALGYPTTMRGDMADGLPQALVSRGSVVSLGEEAGTKFVQADNRVEPGMRVDRSSTNAAWCSPSRAARPSGWRATPRRGTASRSSSR
jgi:hypothetical protein